MGSNGLDFGPIFRSVLSGWFMLSVGSIMPPRMQFTQAPIESRPRQIAAAPVSPVRIRITSARDDTKFLPSPIFPVRAALTMVSTAA